MTYPEVGISGENRQWIADNSHYPESDNYDYAQGIYALREVIMEKTTLDLS